MSALHRRLERFEIVELQFRADAADEIDAEPPPVDVLGEIEDVGLEQRRAVVDRRPDAETRDAVEPPRRRAHARTA